MLRASLLVAAISVTTAVSASAAPYQRESSEIRVSAARYDLTDPAQVQAFHAKLKRAAESVCYGQGVLDRRARMAADVCAKDNLDRAVASLNVPLLAAYNQGRSITPSVEMARAGR